MISSTGLFASATTVTIQSGDVVALTNALATYQGNSHTIYLEPGDYDLTGIQMEDDSVSGGSHLFLKYSKIIGKGETPWDTRLVGDATHRILRVQNDSGYDGPFGAVIQNLTFTNGYAKKVADVANSGIGGGVYGYPIATNCVFIGNRAEGSGGGIGGGTYTWFCKILNNTSGGIGGGAYHPNYLYNCEVRNNTAADSGGGVGQGSTYGRIVDSVIVGNTSGVYGGGVFWTAMVTNTVIAENVCVSGGGGYFTWTAPTDATSPCRMYDCIVCSNNATSGTGGGVWNAKVYRTKVFANRANNGGGTQDCISEDSEIHDNYAGGEGGGVRNRSCTNCRIWNNFAGGAGQNAKDVHFFNCDVSGTGLYGGSASGTFFHDVGGVTISGNPYKEDASFSSGNFWAGVPVATNCLFRNIVIRGSGSTDGYSTILFVGDSGQPRGMSFVNCTIVSNNFGKTFAYTREPYPSEVKNCVFFGNLVYGNSYSDIHSWEDVTEAGIRFSNCAYFKSSGKFATLNGFSDDPTTLYKFGANGFPAKPGFMGEQDPEHPYALKRSSPLRGRGAYEGWMASAYDIRGEGYARATDDHKVDIGAYQCWIPAPGLMLLLR